MELGAKAEVGCVGNGQSNARSLLQYRPVMFDSVMCVPKKQRNYEYIGFLEWLGCVLNIKTCTRSSSRLELWHSERLPLKLLHIHTPCAPRVERLGCPRP